MLHIFDVTFPFFALVLVGWAVGRRGWISLDAIPALNVFVLYFALPCMLFRFAAATPIARLFDASVFGTWWVCAVLMTALALVATRRGHIGWNDAAFGALVVAFPNAGFIGVPLMVDLLGPKAAAPAIAAISVDMVFTTSLCIAISRLESAGSHGARRAALQALRGVAANPLPWAIVVGCIVNGTDTHLPHWMLKPVTLLADAASPTALFTLGLVLARPAKVHSVRMADGGAVIHARSDVPLVVALKLIVHPLVVMTAAAVAVALGVPLDPFAAMVLTLMAALPSASNVTMLAERFGADAGRIARIVLISTTLAFVTFTAAVALLTDPGMRT